MANVTVLRYLTLIGIGLHQSLIASASQKRFSRVSSPIHVLASFGFILPGRHDYRHLYGVSGLGTNRLA
jgi:hypothetical protein